MCGKVRTKQKVPLLTLSLVISLQAVLLPHAELQSKNKAKSSFTHLLSRYKLIGCAVAVRQREAATLPRAEAVLQPRAEFVPPNSTASSTNVIYWLIQRVPTDARSEPMPTVGCAQAGANPA